MHSVQWQNYGQGDWQSLLEPGAAIPLAGMLLAFVVVTLIAMCVMCLLFVKALRSGGSTRKLRQLDAREAESFQELQRGFNRMEERRESHETLVMGRSQSPSPYDREIK